MGKPQEKINHAEQNARGWAESIAAMVAALECDYDRLTDLRDEHESLVRDVDDLGGKLEAMRKAGDDPDAEMQGEYDDAVAALDAFKLDNGDELRELTESATIDGDLQESDETARERIQESPLSVQVRSGWYTPGEREQEPEEFEILLSTGGPALRIRGELDEHAQPCRAWLEYQDWGTPWTEYHGEGLEHSNLMTFCQQFYFGG